MFTSPTELDHLKLKYFSSSMKFHNFWVWMKGRKTFSLSGSFNVWVVGLGIRIFFCFCARTCQHYFLLFLHNCLINSLSEPKKWIRRKYVKCCVAFGTITLAHRASNHIQFNYNVHPHVVIMLTVVQFTASLIQRFLCSYWWVCCCASIFLAQWVFNPHMKRL